MLPLKEDCFIAHFVDDFTDKNFKLDFEQK